MQFIIINIEAKRKGILYLSKMINRQTLSFYLFEEIVNNKKDIDGAAASNKIPT